MHWSDPQRADLSRPKSNAPGPAGRRRGAGSVTSGLIGAVLVRLLVGLAVAAFAVLRLRSDALVVLAVLATVVGVAGVARNRSGRHPVEHRAIIVADGDALAPMIGDLARRDDWQLVGAFGRCERVARARGVRWLGGTDDLEHFVADRSEEPPVEVVVVASESMRDDSVRVALARARRAGVDVVIDSGVRGVDSRRLRPVGSRDNGWMSLRHERCPSIRAVAKRSLDVVVASSMLLIAAPLMAVVAIAVKTSDGGPVWFEQWRVGRDGRRFRMRKFRTMVVDAENRLAGLAAKNERQGGPLFKLDDDPRVTSVGRFLRATSLDELPQLFHVLSGSMSLVGPRPALPSEVAEFDPRLGSRHDVRPGITGLWQIEARDDASFDAYRRCDVFYVENWSLRLDLAILARTFPAVLGRGWRAFRRRTTTRPDRVAWPAAAGRSATAGWIGVGHDR